MKLKLERNYFQVKLLYTYRLFTFVVLEVASLLGVSAPSELGF